MGGYLVCFYIFAIANSATVNTGTPVSLKRPWFQFFPMHTQKWWDCWIMQWLYFDFLRKLYTVFHSSNCTILHPFKQCAKVSKVSISPYPREHFFFFLITAILTGWSDISLWLWFISLWIPTYLCKLLEDSAEGQTLAKWFLATFFLYLSRYLA